MADHESELLAPTPGARVSTFLKRKDVSQTLILWIFFTAVFVKKDGTERKINCQYMADQDMSNLGYVKVTDMVKKKSTPQDCIRNINLQTLKSLCIGKILYKIK